MRGGGGMQEKSLWNDIGTECLLKAKNLLKIDPSEEALRSVQILVNIAVSIDELNLRWYQNQSYEQV